MTNEHTPCPVGTRLGLIYASWLLRLWLAVRAIQTGFEKYAGIRSSDQPLTVDGVPNEEGLSAITSAKAYAFENYHGVPAALMKRFEAEPLVLKPALVLYDKILGPALIILGITLLLGLAYRTSLFLLGIIYISLTWGLILLKQDDGVSWLGIHMIIVAAALVLADHNRFSILKKW